jgi:hypothetical protein
MKEIEENTNKWKGSHVHGLEKLMFLQYLYYPKQSADLRQCLSKFQ